MTRPLLLSAATLALCAAAPAAAQGSDPLEPILACRAIEDPMERLDCFDRAAADLGGQVESGEVAAVNREEVEAVERDGFGLDLPSLPRLSFSVFGRGGGDAPEAPAEPSPREVGIAEAEAEPEVRVVERTEDGQIDRVVMTIDEITTHGYNTKRFRMTNGQLWEATDGMRFNVPRTRDGERLTAEIRRARAGGFFLRINGEGRAIRVQRLR